MYIGGPKFDPQPARNDVTITLQCTDLEDATPLSADSQVKRDKSAAG